jgi:putative transposase
VNHLPVERCPQAQGARDENAKLKKLLAEAMLDNAILKDVAAKNGDARCEAGCGGSHPCAATIISH